MFFITIAYFDFKIIWRMDITRYFKRKREEDELNDRPNAQNETSTPAQPPVPEFIADEVRAEPESSDERE